MNNLILLVHYYSADEFVLLVEVERFYKLNFQSKVTSVRWCVWYL